MAREPSQRRWSAKVTETSDALDLEDNIFKSRSARRIAASLKHFRRAQPSPQSRSVSIGHVDAEFLHQPDRQKPAGFTQKGAGGSKIRIAPAIWPQRPGLNQRPPAL